MANKSCKHQIIDLGRFAVSAGAVLAITICLVVFAAAGPARAAGDLLQTVEYQVTFDLDAQSTPTIGHDALGDSIVYTSRSLANGGLGTSDIYYQRVSLGQLVGPKVAVADSPDNEYLNDVSGDYIVYSVAPPLKSVAKIVLYQISTGQSRDLTAQGARTSPKIFGDVVVWLQGSYGGAQVMMYKISSGVPVQPAIIAGPVPSAREVQIGDRFIVWSQLVNGQSDIAAYDIQSGVSFSVATDPGVDETNPMTDGAWVVFQTRNRTADSGIAVYAVNLDTWEVREVVNNGALNMRPNVNGNLIAYESNLPGNWDIFVYRLAQGDTFQVTTRPEDQSLNDLLGSLVAYVHNRNGFNNDVFTSILTFIPRNPITIKVDCHAPGPLQDGITWATAYKTIQEAIDKATDGDEIWVKAGVYELSSRINVNKAVAIYGGFAGTETAKHERDWETNVTTVDGQDTVGCFCVSADATIDGFTITNGFAKEGGGIYTGVSDAPDVVTEIANCTFYGNTAWVGGGICSNHSYTSITNCTFSGNIACLWEGYLHDGGGGGIFSTDSYNIITNCTFYGNSADDFGGGICDYGYGCIMTNCILWGNTDFWRGYESEDESAQIAGYGNSPVVTYSCVQGWTGSLGGTGNTGDNPLFADADGRLSGSSPCIDAGDNTAVPSGVTTDLDGNPRIVGAAVDMGAYEYQYLTNTPPGTNVIVQPVDSGTGTQPVTVKFAEVTEPGSTTLTISDSGPTPPEGFKLAGKYYDITTTASYTPPVTVCIQYDDTGMTLAQENALRLYHGEDGEWVDVTISPVDTANNIICGKVSSLSVFAVFAENQPPTADAGADQTIEATDQDGSEVTLDGSGSFDPDDDPLTYYWTWDGGSASGISPTVTLPLGTTTVTLVVNDGTVDSNPDTVDITVQDTTPPTITSISASPAVLWPPNHNMVDVTVTLDCEDICDSAPVCFILGVSCNEPVNGPGDGNTEPDWDFTGDPLVVLLQAERSGTGTGRTYTIYIECTDASGNTSTGTVDVTVPHDQGKGKGKK